MENPFILFLALCWVQLSVIDPNALDKDVHTLVHGVGQFHSATSRLYTLGFPKYLPVLISMLLEQFNSKTVSRFVWIYGIQGTIKGTMTANLLFKSHTPSN